jgi:hypothetical protein
MSVYLYENRWIIKIFMRYIDIIYTLLYHILSGVELSYLVCQSTHFTTCYPNPQPILDPLFSVPHFFLFCYRDDDWHRFIHRFPTKDHCKHDGSSLLIQKKDTTGVYFTLFHFIGLVCETFSTIVYVESFRILCGLWVLNIFRIL